MSEKLPVQKIDGEPFPGKPCLTHPLSEADLHSSTPEELLGWLNAVQVGLGEAISTEEEFQGQDLKNDGPERTEIKNRIIELSHTLFETAAEDGMWVYDASAQKGEWVSIKNESSQIEQDIAAVENELAIARDAFVDDTNRRKIGFMQAELAELKSAGTELDGGLVSRKLNELRKELASLGRAAASDESDTAKAGGAEAASDGIEVTPVEGTETEAQVQNRVATQELAELGLDIEDEEGARTLLKNFANQYQDFISAVPDNLRSVEWQRAQDWLDELVPLFERVRTGAGMTYKDGAAELLNKIKGLDAIQERLSNSMETLARMPVDSTAERGVSKEGEEGEPPAAAQQQNAIVPVGGRVEATDERANGLAELETILNEIKRDFTDDPQLGSYVEVLMEGLQEVKGKAGARVDDYRAAFMKLRQKLEERKVIREQKAERKTLRTELDALKADVLSTFTGLGVDHPLVRELKPKVDAYENTPSSPDPESDTLSDVIVQYKSSIDRYKAFQEELRVALIQRLLTENGTVTPTSVFEAYGIQNEDAAKLLDKLVADSVLQQNALGGYVSAAVAENADEGDGRVPAAPVPDETEADSGSLTEGTDEGVMQVEEFDVDLQARYLDGLSEKKKELYMQAWDVVRASEQPSIATLTRQLGITHGPAAEVFNRMIAVGLVEKGDKSVPYKILKPHFAFTAMGSADTAADQSLEYTEEEYVAQIEALLAKDSAVSVTSVSEGCRISGEEAERLLQKLVQQGVLTPPNPFGAYVRAEPEVNADKVADVAAGSPEPTEKSPETSAQQGEEAAQSGERTTIPVRLLEGVKPSEQTLYLRAWDLAVAQGRISAAQIAEKLSSERTNIDLSTASTIVLHMADVGILGEADRRGVRKIVGVATPDVEEDASATPDTGDTTAPAEKVATKDPATPERSPWLTAREKYRTYKDELHVAQQKYYDAIEAYEKEKKETGTFAKVKGLGSTAEMQTKKAAMEAAENEYNTYLQRVRSERATRQEAFRERLILRAGTSDAEAEKRILQRKQRYIAVHEAILNRHTDLAVLEVGLLRGIAGARDISEFREEHMKGFDDTDTAKQHLKKLYAADEKRTQEMRAAAVEKEAKRWRITRASKQIYEAYRKLPMSKKIAYGAVFSAGVGAGAALLGGAALGAAGTTAFGAGLRRVVGGTIGMGATIGTKLGVDRGAEKLEAVRMERQKDAFTNVSNEEYASKDLAQARAERLKIKRDTRNIKRVGTVAAAGVGFASGATASGIAEQLHAGVDIQNLDVGKGIEDYASRLQNGFGAAQKAGSDAVDSVGTAEGGSGLVDRVQGAFERTWDDLTGDEPQAPVQPGAAPERIPVPAQAPEASVENQVPPERTPAHVASPERPTAPTTAPEAGGAPERLAVSPVRIVESYTGGNIFQGIDKLVRDRLPGMNPQIADTVSVRLQEILMEGRTEAELAKLNLGYFNGDTGKALIVLDPNKSFSLDVSDAELKRALGDATAHAAGKAAVAEHLSVEREAQTRLVQDSGKAATAERLSADAEAQQRAYDSVRFRENGDNTQVPPQGRAEAPPQKLSLKGSYEANSSVERELQAFVKNDEWINKTYPDLTDAQRGAVATRLRLALMKDPSMDDTLKVRGGNWNDVAKGEVYDVKVDRALVQREIDAVRGNRSGFRAAAPADRPNGQGAYEARPQGARTGAPVEVEGARKMPGANPRMQDFPHIDDATLNSAVRELSGMSGEVTGAPDGQSWSQMKWLIENNPRVAKSMHGWMHPPFRSALHTIEQVKVADLQDNVPGVRGAVPVSPELERVLRGALSGLRSASGPDADYLGAKSTMTLAQAIQETYKRNAAYVPSESSDVVLVSPPEPASRAPQSLIPPDEVQRTNVPDTESEQLADRFEESRHSQNPTYEDDVRLTRSDAILDQANEVVDTRMHQAGYRSGRAPGTVRVQGDVRYDQRHGVRVRGGVVYDERGARVRADGRHIYERRVPRPRVVSGGRTTMSTGAVYESQTPIPGGGELVSEGGAGVRMRVRESPRVDVSRVAYDQRMVDTFGPDSYKQMYGGIFGDSVFDEQADIPRFQSLKCSAKDIIDLNPTGRQALIEAGLSDHAKELQGFMIKEQRSLMGAARLEANRGAGVKTAPGYKVIGPDPANMSPDQYYKTMYALRNGGLKAAADANIRRPVGPRVTVTGGPRGVQVRRT